MTLYAKDISALTMLAKVDDLPLSERRALEKEMSPSGRMVARALNNSHGATPAAKRAAAKLKRYASKDLPTAPIFAARSFAP